MGIVQRIRYDLTHVHSPVDHENTEGSLLNTKPGEESSVNGWTCHDTTSVTSYEYI